MNYAQKSAQKSAQNSTETDTVDRRPGPATGGFGALGNGFLLGLLQASTEATKTDTEDTKTDTEDTKTDPWVRTNPFGPGIDNPDGSREMFPVCEQEMPTVGATPQEASPQSTGVVNTLVSTLTEWVVMPPMVAVVSPWLGEKQEELTEENRIIEVALMVRWIETDKGWFPQKITLVPKADEGFGLSVETSIEHLEIGGHPSFWVSILVTYGGSSTKISGSDSVTSEISEKDVGKVGAKSERKFETTLTQPQAGAYLDFQGVNIPGQRTQVKVNAYRPPNPEGLVAEGLTNKLEYFGREPRAGGDLREGLPFELLKTQPRD